MNDTKVFFCGLSKKAEYSLIKKNIDFIIDYSNISKFDIYLIVIDSDSEKNKRLFNGYGKEKYKYHCCKPR